MTDLILPRRGLLSGIIAFACAPAIVRASSLMAVKPFKNQADGNFLSLNDDIESLRRFGGYPTVFLGNFRIVYIFGTDYDFLRAP